MKEEVGFEREDLKVHFNFQAILTYLVRGNKEKMSIYWLAELVDADKFVKLSNEHQDYKWLTLDNAAEYVKFDEMMKALRNCDKFLNLNGIK